MCQQGLTTPGCIISYDRISLIKVSTPHGYVIDGYVLSGYVLDCYAIAGCSFDGYVLDLYSIDGYVIDCYVPFCCQPLSYQEVKTVTMVLATLASEGRLAYQNVGASNSNPRASVASG